MLQLFSSLQTQWAVAVGMGGGGRIGLRYEVVYPLLDKISKGDEAQWSQLFSDIQAMEMAVLQIPVKQR